MIEERVLEVLRTTFKDPSISESCSQKTCPAWDSMGQLNLVVELEMEFDVSLEPEEIGSMRCFADVVNIIKAKL